MEITERLFSLRDSAYADFQIRLIPGLSEKEVIGVRVPELRRLAKELKSVPEAERFLHGLPHAYFDENMLHGMLLSEIRDYEACVKALDAFLPHVDNWAVCDTVSPAAFRSHRGELIGDVRKWIASEREYTCRFGIRMLMNHYLGEDFRPEYPELVAKIHRNEYYVQMMAAWYFATALAKRWEDVIPYLEGHALDPRVHGKAIQKARESYRITAEQKEYLLTLKG